MYELLGLFRVARLPCHQAQLPGSPGNLRYRRRLTVEVERLRQPAFSLLVLPSHSVEPAFRLCGACARDDAAAFLGQRKRAVDERFRLLVVHAADVDPCQLERGPRLVVLPSSRPRCLERLLLEILGLPLSSCPPGHACAAVEGSETAFVIVFFDNRERLVRKLCCAPEITVERSHHLGERRERPTLDAAGSLRFGLFRDDAHPLA